MTTSGGLDEGMTIATLIAAGRLDDRLIERALGLLREIDPRAGFLHWIDEGDAADLRFIGDPKAARWAIDGLEGIDLVVQPEEPRWKRLLVADMDSTMITVECIDELADYAGVKDRVAAITERAMRGEIAFAPALRERVALLQGLPAATINQVIAERIRPNPGATTLIRTMRANGAYTCVVTGGFTAFMAPLAKAIGFDEYHANILLTDSAGRLTGQVAEPVLGRNAKRDTLLRLAERLRLRREETLAVGDGANDIPMIEAAGLGVAFHGKPALREAAHACIDHGDLTALLYAQGYRREDFAETAKE